jgi:hypothetical protein
MSLEEDAAEFGRHFEGGWQLGLLVARNVHKQSRAGRPKSEQVRNKVSCAKFADKAQVSERTVQLYYDTWQLAAKEGHCTPAEQLSPDKDDPKLVDVDVDSDERRGLWRDFYQAARPNAGGGARGIKPADKVTRAKSVIEKITGLEGDAAVLHTEVCNLLDKLLASIKGHRITLKH